MQAMQQTGPPERSSPTRLRVRRWRARCWRRPRWFTPPPPPPPPLLLSAASASASAPEATRACQPQVRAPVSGRAEVSTVRAPTSAYEWGGGLGGLGHMGKLDSPEQARAEPETGALRKMRLRFAAAMAESYGARELEELEHCDDVDPAQHDDPHHRRGKRRVVHPRPRPRPRTPCSAAPPLARMRGCFASAAAAAER